MTESEPPSGSERRAAPRGEAYVAAELTTEAGKQRLAVVQDVSAVGVQILTATRVEVDERVAVRIHVDDETIIGVEGTIVRRIELPPGGAWRFRLGISVQPPSDDLARHADAINAHQQKLSSEAP